MSLKDKLNTYKHEILRSIDKKRNEVAELEKEIEVTVRLINKEIASEKEEIDKKLDRLAKESIRIERERINIKTEREKEEERIDRHRAYAESMIDRHMNGIIDNIEELAAYGKSPKLIDAYINACFDLDEKIAVYFKNKKRPNLTSAEIVRELKKENRSYLNRIKDLEYQISEMCGEDIDTSKNEDFESTDDDDDRTSFFLNRTEYSMLSNREKYQRALDNYWNGKFSKAYVGKMYERYIGYLYEQDGYQVEYRGIEMGVKDGGVDLVCTKGFLRLLVQCKFWKQESTIYEKHICQLYGSATYYGKLYDERDSSGTLFQDSMMYDVVPVFVSTTRLDEQAEKVANKLKVIVKYISYKKGYPVIKCNVSSSGEKIYHLPFDQMYDHTKISKEGECYVATVAEAEALGFRRAKRHQWKNE